MRTTCHRPDPDILVIPSRSRAVAYRLPPQRSNGSPMTACAAAGESQRSARRGGTPVRCGRHRTERRPLRQPPAAPVRWRRRDHRAGDPRQRPRLHRRGRRAAGVHQLLADDVCEDRAVIADEREVAVLKRTVSAAVDADEPIGVRDAGYRTREKGVRDRVDGDVRANAAGEREDRDGGEARRSKQPSERIPGVVHSRGVWALSIEARAHPTSRTARGFRERLRRFSRVPRR